MAYQLGDQPVPGYRLESFLGQGSYGSVWKAVGPGGVPCAMKFISLDSKSGLKEMKAIGLVKRLQHPNLCPVQAIWLKDKEGNLMSDTPTGSESTRFMLGGNKELIIAMGLGSKTLAQRLEECRGRGGIPIRDLIRYMEDAAKGIDYLNEPVHDLGHGPSSVIHCDIKPANLLIVGGGVQVCDYGVARALTATGQDVRKTFAAGTPAYAPAELINNEPCGHTDQYSLAITYFELRTGHLPFEEAKAIIANLTGALNLDDLPPDEREVIRQATSVQPAQRFESCQEMVEALKMASGVTVTTMMRSSRSGPSSSGFQLEPPSSSLGTPRSTPQPPGSDPRYTPPGSPNPRGTDRVRFTPEPPEGYGGSGGLWPPSGPLVPPKSGGQAAPGSGRPGGFADDPAPPKPNTPPQGRGPAYPEGGSQPVPLLPEPTPGAYHSEGTIRFDGSLPPPAPPQQRGFADNPNSNRQTPSNSSSQAAPWETPPKKRAQANTAADELQKRFNESPATPTNNKKPQKPGGSGMGVILAMLTLLILGGGGAAGYFLIIKPKMDQASMGSGTGTGTGSPGTTAPTTKPENPEYARLVNEITTGFEKKDYGNLGKKIDELAKLDVPDAKDKSATFKKKLDTAIALVPLRKQIEDAIKNQDSIDAQQVMAKIQALDPTVAGEYSQQVRDIKTPDDPVKLARNEFNKGKLKEGLDLLEKALKDTKSKLKPDQISTANKLVTLWKGVQAEVNKSRLTLTDLQAFQSAVQKLAVSADAVDTVDVDKYLEKELASRVEMLLPTLMGVKLTEWRWLNELGKSASAGSVLQAASVEAAIELKANSKTSNPVGLDREIKPDVNSKFADYPAYLEGYRDYLKTTRKPEEIVESWQGKFNPMPAWVTKDRASRIAEVVRAALPSTDSKVAKQRYEKWTTFIKLVDGRSGQITPKPSELDLSGFEAILAKLTPAANAKFADYPKAYATLKLLNTTEGKASFTNLPAGDKKKAASALAAAGRHLLVNSVAWNAVSEIQADKLLAEIVAERAFEMANTLDKNGDFIAWQLLAKLSQPSVKLSDLGSLPSAADNNEASSKVRELVKLLTSQVSARFTANNIPDLKDRILGLRTNHDAYLALIRETPNTQTDVDRLALKHALRHGIVLLETDQSNYFRQEQLNKTLTSWAAALDTSADGLLLKAHHLEVACNRLKPYTRFDQAEGKPNYGTVRQLVNDADLLLDQQSVEAKLAYARAVYISTTDKAAAKSERQVGVTPSILAAMTALKECLTKAAELPNPDFKCELYYWSGQLGMNAAATEGDMQKAFDHVAVALKHFEDCVALARLHPLGHRVEDAVYAQMKARELDVLIAYKFGDSGSGLKIQSFNRAMLEINKLPGLNHLKARGYLTGRELLARQDGGFASIAEYRTAIAKLPNDPKSLTTQEAEELSRLSCELGIRILLSQIVGYGSPEQRQQAIGYIGEACKEFTVAYKLIDSHPFQNATVKAISAGYLGKWTRFKGQVYEMDAKKADYMKAYQESIEPLKYSLWYTPLVEDYWVWQAQLGLSSLIVASLGEGTPDDSTGLVTTVQAIRDAQIRLREAKESRSNRVGEDKGTLAELNKASGQLPTLGKVLRKLLEAGQSKLSVSDKLLADLALAEIDLVDPSLENFDSGKALANKTLPDLKKLAADTKLTPYERYKYQRIVDRVEALLK